MFGKDVKYPMALAVAIVFVCSFALVNTAQADTSTKSSATTPLTAGYVLGANGQASCGGDKEEAEGKCGGDKEAEASCGGDKEEAEGKCGGAKEGEAQEAEASCGGDKEEAEGKCGGAKEGEAQEAEASCGGDKEEAEGKCGGKRPKVNVAKENVVANRLR
jgi:hypothetical protein